MFEAKKQFGFGNKRSTADAIVETLEVLIETKNTAKLTHCAHLDLSKAFDTVDQNTYSQQSILRVGRCSS